MKAFFEGFFWSLVIIMGSFFIIYVFVSSISDAMDKDEINECRQWQEYAAQFDGFYLVQWQKDQCDAHSVIINAPVR